MKITLALLLVLFTARAVEAQSGCGDKWPDAGFNLAGRLDAKAIEAYLDRGHPMEGPDGVSGVFFYPDLWKSGADDAVSAFTLEGAFTGDCEISLTDTAGATWRLRFLDAARLTGTRVLAGTSASVELHVVPQPDCGGRGAWRTFQSSDWPVTFEYPASWRMRTRDDGQVEFQCPSAGDMARGGPTIIVRSDSGRVTATTEAGRSAEHIEEFTTFGRDVWFVGFTCDEREPDDLGVFCNPAKKSTRGGMTVIEGSLGEHRLYRPGSGYIGQGPGYDSYLFMLGDRWVRVRSGEAGPVTARLVRSVRRR